MPSAQWSSGGDVFDFNPAAVMMKSRGMAGVPYLGGVPPAEPPRPHLGGGPESVPGAPSAPQFGTLAPESIRAIGAGPFDPAYRQNLATYAGGQFARPSGMLNFNPTNAASFPGQPVGGGTAPTLGMPQTLLEMALGGQPFSWTQPQQSKQQTHPISFWLDHFLRMGGGGWNWGGRRRESL